MTAQMMQQFDYQAFSLQAESYIFIRMLRSESMDYYQLVLPRESAWQIMNALGQVDSIHIVETKSVLKPFQPQVKRCEESLIKIANFERMLADNGINTHKIPRDSYEYSRLFEYWTQKSYESRKIAISMLDELDSEIDKQWEYYMDLNKRLQSTTLQLINSQSKMAVLKASELTLGNNFYESLSRKAEPARSSSRSWEVGNVSYKCGIIKKEEESRFQRLVFRMSKGNAYTNFVPVDSVYMSDQQEMNNRSVFFILFPSRDIMYLESKLNKLIENYSQDIIDLPQNKEALAKEIQHLTKAIEDYKAILKLTRDERDQFLSKLVSIALPDHPLTKIQYLKIFMVKERQIYHQLNQMDVFNNFIQGRIYIPAKDFQTVRKLLSKLQRKDSPTAQLIKHSTKTNPTLFQTNSFTISAQQIVQTYGIPRYKEANPGLFTCITFPFLFGVMFGDIMHGAIVLAFGLMLVFNKEKYERTFLSILTPHRYLITLMGVFSFYCGFIYNDYLSINLNLFGSCYQPNLAQPGGLIPRISNECVYPFGVDPVWGITSNGLTFLNSMKMKISVIIGVVHMAAGVLLKATNAIYFRSFMDFFFEFVPQIIFLILLFGYMDFLIIYKWNVDWGLFPANAPSIITTMINLPLALGKTQNCCGGQPMWGDYQTTSQNTIQLIFLIVALLCIPLMLLPKPLYEIYCSKHRPNLEKHGQLLMSEDHLAQDLAKKSSIIEAEQQVHSSDEIFVHQMIETIEYVLGCISNTASYLRLWALSLAHSQLAQVFFDKTVEHSIVEGYAGIPLMLFGFLVLALATFGVLLCMDTMECFLHSLRLHWVEFQNKFYKADGFAFVSYSFKGVVVKAMGHD